MPTPRKANNIELLMIASDALEPLLDRLVFVGGATTGLLITDPAAPDIRATRDVDVIIEVQHYGEYRRLEQTLQDLGFRPDQDEDAPLCRFRHKDIILDVMPTDENILGFNNPWYRPAITSAVQLTLENAKTIHHATAPYFVGTKLAAFEGRGNQDFLSSHDMEDILAVINGRPELVEELQTAEKPLRNYIGERFKYYLTVPAFRQNLPGMIIEESTRMGILIERMEAIAQMSK